MADTPRELAYRTLLDAERNSTRSIDEILSDQLSHSQFSAQEKAWILELVYGTTRMKLQLDTWIQSAYTGRYLKAQYAIKVLLRLGVFQLKFMKTAEHAAINETVNLSKKVGQKGASRLINAVLRQIQTREFDEILDKINDPTEKIAIETSHPVWMVGNWLARYETDEVFALCRHNNTSPQTWIRRNIQQVDALDFENYFERLGVQYQKSNLLEQFYLIDSGAVLLNTSEFHKGYFSFQDLAAGLVANLIHPREGETIIDACAAPGGKMAFLSELSRGGSKIIACDASSSRLRRVRQTVERLKLSQVSIVELDASADAFTEADKILLDVPCSGTGVLNRRPDARWRRQPHDIAALTVIQGKILLNTWKYLKPGGMLIYATCTLEPSENWDLIDSVLGNLNDAQLEPIEDEKLKPYIDERGALSTLPWRDGMDGMFAVKIRKMS
ncbi:MAG: 16S rRNA (cytosine(967)-C(5))-methyltransferase RsmB [Candidatus Marinimicrobia bacterium]|nr:16S rRNA (cytosine(967)-C(5))-methyltransferase RsmB [Candidatus Neomarinimicrobiota bacterium]